MFVPSVLSSLPPKIKFLMVAGALVGLSHGLDPWAQVALSDPNIYEGDFGRLLRVIGFYPLWLLVALGLILSDWKPGAPVGMRRRCIRRALPVILAPALGGLVAEVGKITFRRLRPGEVPGEYMFRPLLERPFYSGGLGLPSSHTMVAFAAASIMARIFPRTAPIWYLLAVGCGLSRVAAGAHFLSDVAVAGVLGWLTGWVVWTWHQRTDARPAMGETVTQRDAVPQGG
jgi:membrane-associated phospholipid phosphatase